MSRAWILSIPDGWTPTPENINALPDPLRKFIHDLETRCDPAGDVRSRVMAEDAVRSLERELDSLERELHRVKATAKGSFDRGWEKGGEAMRAAIIREVEG